MENEKVSSIKQVNVAILNGGSLSELLKKVKASRQDFQNSVPSYIWSYESIRVTKQILAQGKPERITCPVLLFSAETDSSVLPGPQSELISRIPDGQYVLVRNARHEIYRSGNEVLFPWWHETVSFLSESVSGSIPAGGDCL